MDVKLNDEQRDLVEANHKLIYWYINLKNLDIQEWYDILAIELCYTVMKYNEERGSLSTYFKMRADGLVYKEYRKNMAQKRAHTEEYYIDGVAYGDEVYHSPDREVNKHDNGFKSRFSESYSAPQQVDAEVKDLFSGENGDILKLKYEGYSQAEIGAALGYSQSHVSKILKGLRKTYDHNR